MSNGYETGEPERFADMSPFFKKLGEELVRAAKEEFAEQRRQMKQFGLDPETEADCDTWEAMLANAPEPTDEPYDYVDDVWAYGNGPSPLQK